jgi:hypothetical protein
MPDSFWWTAAVNFMWFAVGVYIGFTVKIRYSD